MLKYKYILFGSFITPEMECQVEHIALWDTYCMMCTLKMLQYTAEIVECYRMQDIGLDFLKRPLINNIYLLYDPVTYNTSIDMCECACVSLC